jgi:hypothetical protein
MADLKEWNEVGSKSFDSSELDALVAELYRVGKLYEEIDAQKKEASGLWDELQAKILRILTDAKKSNYKVDGVGLVSTKTKLVVKIPDGIESQRAFKQWCLEKYGPDFVDSSFKMGSQALTKFYNTEAENAESPNFSIPGIEAPTQVVSLAFRTEAK